jgi:hypothetical protein
MRIGPLKDFWFLLLAAGAVACSSGGDFTVGPDDGDSGSGMQGSGASATGSGSGSGGATGSSSGSSSGEAGSGETGSGTGGDTDGSTGSSSSGTAGSTSGSGGQSTGSGSGGSGGMGGGGVPTVLLLVDGSSSMFDAMLWEPTYEVLMNPDTGVVAAFEDRVRFGFMSFHGNSTPTSEEDAACATLNSVEYAFDNRDAIDAVYGAILAARDLLVKWETPTGHVIRRAAMSLDADAGDKYILMITDGDPNTCRTLDPQCGQDVAIAAAQYAYGLGIRTLVVGVGDFADAATACDSYTRCGPGYLQDMANAGIGEPVAPQDPNYIYQPCAAANGNMLVANYADAGGTASFSLAATPEALDTELTRVLQAIVDGAVP